MVYYAVIDTNVFISALFSKRADATTVRVLDAMFDGKIVPLYHEDILAEYDEVLHRSKFHFKEATIQLVINAVKQYGMEVFPQPTGEILGFSYYHLKNYPSLQYTWSEGIKFYQYAVCSFVSSSFATARSSSSFFAISHSTI